MINNLTEIAPHIVLDPAILVGRPIIAGTRLSVEFILGLLADGWSFADVLDEYQGISEEDIRACISYARGHDVVWARTAMPAAGDEVILARAISEGRVCITFDKDFGALAVDAMASTAVGIILGHCA